MEAVVEKGHIILPKEIIKEISLPEKGRCEVEVVNGELHIKKTTSGKASRILDDLKKPPVRMSIDEIIYAEVVEDV